MDVEKTHGHLTGTREIVTGDDEWHVRQLRVDTVFVPPGAVLAEHLTVVREGDNVVKRCGEVLEEPPVDVGEIARTVVVGLSDLCGVNKAEQYVTHGVCSGRWFDSPVRRWSHIGLVGLHHVEEEERGVVIVSRSDYVGCLLCPTIGEFVSTSKLEACANEERVHRSTLGRETLVDAAKVLLDASVGSRPAEFPPIKQIVVRRLEPGRDVEVFEPTVEPEVRCEVRVGAKCVRCVPGRTQLFSERWLFTVELEVLRVGADLATVPTSEEGRVRGYGPVGCRVCAFEPSAGEPFEVAVERILPECVEHDQRECGHR